MRRKLVVFAIAPIAPIAPMLLAACAQIFGAKDISIDEDAGPGRDAGGDGASGGEGPQDGGDADADAAACDPNKPFGKPTPIALLQTGYDWTARFTADELTMFVWSDRSGAPGTFAAKRGLVRDAFVALDPLSYGGDGGPYLNVAPSESGLTVIVEAAGPTGDSDLFEATRTSPDASFGTPTPIAPASKADENEVQGYLLSARGVLYFAATTTGVPTELYKSVASGGVWQPRVPIGELNTPSFETFPTLTPDEKTIYFGSDRDETGNSDIWVARRDDAAATFSPPDKVAELSSARFEVPTWVSADGCRLAYRQNTVGGTDNAVFIATRGR